ncbi:expressed unknown protein [Seminavis robusta]|uniref:Uncharacterized protein n=1 Tax=Seminavis robusta TaxID=568900 RepID=A0A9N8H603_9STRA|nr:expressed unknown protein [Seminavis robusta]|eukprot:Sro130_g061991.1  (128) ;mRNA; f:84014-84397
MPFLIYATRDVLLGIRALASSAMLDSMRTSSWDRLSTTLGRNFSEASRGQSYTLKNVKFLSLNNSEGTVPGNSLESIMLAMANACQVATCSRSVPVSWVMTKNPKLIRQSKLPSSVGTVPHIPAPPR